MLELTPDIITDSYNAYVWKTFEDDFRCFNHIKDCVIPDLTEGYCTTVVDKYFVLVFMTNGTSMLVIEDLDTHEYKKFTSSNSYLFECVKRLHKSSFQLNKALRWPSLEYLECDTTHINYNNEHVLENYMTLDMLDTIVTRKNIKCFFYPEVSQIISVFWEEHQLDKLTVQLFDLTTNTYDVKHCASVHDFPSYFTLCNDVHTVRKPESNLVDMCKFAEAAIKYAVLHKLSPDYFVAEFMKIGSCQENITLQEFTKLLNDLNREV